MRSPRSLGLVMAVALALSLLPGAVGLAQLRTALVPSQASKLRPGELIRYFKVRPQDRQDGLPYQVLIVVTLDSCTVTTNQWQVVQKLNDAQRADIRETLSYQEAKDFARPFVPPEEPPKETTGPHSQLDSYLSFRLGSRVVAWNSRRFGSPRLPSLFDFLEVCHYQARQEKEKPD